MNVYMEKLKVIHLILENRKKINGERQQNDISEVFPQRLK